MPFAEATDDDIRFIKEALAEAQGGYDEGGVPVGSVMVENGRVIARGRNKRVQEGDPIAHGEMDCIRAAGRRPGYRKVTLYTTLSPCMMCTGTILQFEIPRVVVGEDRNFEGNAGFLAERGVEVVTLEDPDCIALMERFIREKPELWNEDIAEE
jgi:cytosine deaminase